MKKHKREVLTLLQNIVTKHVTINNDWTLRLWTLGLGPIVRLYSGLLDP